MHQFNHKNRLIETYSLILIDLISVTLAYLLALFLRFGNVRSVFYMDVTIVYGDILCSFAFCMVL